MIRITLPYPLSANVYWRSFVPRGATRAVTTLSEDAKEYRVSVVRAFAAAGRCSPFRGRVHVHIDLYPARPADWAKRARKDPLAWDDTVRCIDLDNARKVLYDAMKGLAYEDDAQIWEDSAKRREPDAAGARVEVMISEVVRPVDPQLDWMER